MDDDLRPHLPRKGSSDLKQIVALVAYDGSDYSGFQAQTGVPTIQGELEQALSTFTTLKGRINGAGRTDSGVHARGQVVSCSVEWRHTLTSLQRAWNAHLPAAIAVRAVLEAKEDFHARFSAASRIYRYTVVQAVGISLDGYPPERSPVTQRYSAYERRPLNVEAMNQAASFLLGAHDFATFGTPPQGDSTIRTVSRAVWQEVTTNLPPVVEAHKLPGERTLVFTVEANAFLKQMVRKIVGSLLAVGRGDWTVEQFAYCFSAAEGALSAPPAPPNGLVFEAVIYPNRWGIDFGKVE